jgi:hypothetical protein
MYAALQFIALTAVAMAVYGDRYRFFEHFVSELGATRTWAGRANHASMLLFSIALATVGVAFVAFAPTWRAFACQRRVVRVAGLAAHGFGTLSGLAFIAVAVTPVDVALHAHNSLVVVAFGLLAGYALASAVLWACNGVSRALLVANVMFLLLVLAYAAVAVVAVQHGIGTMRARELLVVSQKLFVCAAMVYVAYVTFEMRRQLAWSCTAH